MITRVYWHLWKHSRIGIAILALLGVCGLVVIESFKVKKEQPYYKKKLQAAKLAQRAFSAIRPELLKRKKPDYKEFDPANSGFIGDFLTPVTSNSGSLTAKQTSINPNFAAVLVHLLIRGGVEEGDTIAVSMSGSFPAMNICAYSAFETLKLKVIVIGSASASQYGANHPQMLWLDMESALLDDSIFNIKTSLASLGGTQDKGIGMSVEGKNLLRTAILRNKVLLLTPSSFEDSIKQRIDFYFKLAGNKSIKAFVNVGGGTTILGTSLGKQIFKSGLIKQLPDDVNPPNSVLKSFLEKDIPVVNVIQIESLARKFGLPLVPKKTPLPGEGKVFIQEEYNPYLCVFVIAYLLVGLYGITKKGWGQNPIDFQLPQTVRRKSVTKEKS
jgi:poly-gamma-glutamate system protein